MKTVKASELQEISLDGFQVVSGSFFSHFPRIGEATCSLWNTSISFSKMSIICLNCCERVRLEVNTKTKCILVIPTTESDKDSIRWVKYSDRPYAKKIECREFASQLYKAWHLDEVMVYRTTGKLVKADNKVMMLYNFNDCESWRAKDKNQELK